MSESSTLKYTRHCARCGKGLLSSENCFCVKQEDSLGCPEYTHHLDINGDVFSEGAQIKAAVEYPPTRDSYKESLLIEMAISFIGRANASEKDLDTRTARKLRLFVDALLDQ